jgi:hypothetical protein
MKNTLKDNPYLENIVRDIDRNVRLLQCHNDSDPIGMLRVVIRKCEKVIEVLELLEKRKMENENDNHMGSGAS